MFIFAPKNSGGAVAQQYRALFAPLTTITLEYLPNAFDQRADGFAVTATGGVVTQYIQLAAHGTMAEANGTTGTIQFNYSGMCPGDAYISGSSSTFTGTTNTAVYLLFRG